MALPVIDSRGWDDIPDATDEEDEGDLSLSRSGPATVEELDLAPMVDVAFQLVLFFMVTATTVLYKTLEIPKPSQEQAPTAVAQGRSLEDLQDDNVLVEIDATGGVKIDREPVRHTMEAIVEQLRTAREKTDRKSMLLSADYGTKHRTLRARDRCCARNRHEHRDRQAGGSAGTGAEHVVGTSRAGGTFGSAVRSKVEVADCGGDYWRRLLTAAGIAALLGISALAIFFFQPYGEREWIALALAAMHGGLDPGPQAASGEGRFRLVPRAGRSVPRFLRLAGKVLIGVLGVLAGAHRLVCFEPGRTDASGEVAIRRSSALSPGTSFTARSMVRRGAASAGRCGSVRSSSVLRATAPDILCVQEALDEQVSGLANLLSGYGRVGVGRDDGRSAGEFCAVFFDRGRFEELDGGTFWLEEPTAEPPRHTFFGPKRICTWVRLRDRQSGRAFPRV